MINLGKATVTQTLNGTEILITKEKYKIAVCISLLSAESKHLCLVMPLVIVRKSLVDSIKSSDDVEKQFVHMWDSSSSYQ